MLKKGKEQKPKRKEGELKLDKLEKISLVDILPAEYNPRKINDTEYSKLTDSINTFGLVDPIIINLRNNKIIGGHQRYKVLLDEYTSNNNKYGELNILKLGDIGWVFPSTDLKIESEEQEKALNILLNQTNLMGEWDNEKLKTVLKDLNDVNFDLDITGFDDFEIDLYLDDEYETFNYTHYIEEEEKPEKTTEPAPEETTATEPTQKNTPYEDDEKIGEPEPTPATQHTEPEEEIDYADIIPDDYVEVKGDNANKSYVISIGFNNHETANKFLEYIEYHRRMNRDTLQFMFTELGWDLDTLLQQKQDQKGNHKCIRTTYEEEEEDEDTAD